MDFPEYGKRYKIKTSAIDTKNHPWALNSMVFIGRSEKFFHFQPVNHNLVYVPIDMIDSIVSVEGG